MPQRKYLIPPGDAQMYSDQFKEDYWNAVNNNPKLSDIKAGWLQFSRLLANVCLRQHTQKIKYGANDS